MKTKQLKISRVSAPDSGNKSAIALRRCPILFHPMESGEKIKRGCGHMGMRSGHGAWRCFYCGHYIYRNEQDLSSLWFHFKLGREFWRGITLGGRDYVNGVPVVGQAEELPAVLLGDLKEVRPPRWFAAYMVLDDPRFKKYVETLNL